MNTEPPQGARRPTFGSSAYLAFILFMFFFMGGGQNDPLYQRTLSAAIDRRVLQRARFSDWLYGNTTHEINLPYPIPVEDPLEVARLTEANATYALPSLREPLVDPLVDSLLQEIHPYAHYQHNITGFLRGAWHPLTVSLPEPIASNETNTTTTWASHRGQMAWMEEAKQRKVSLNVRETKESQIDSGLAILRGNLEFEADGTTVRTDVEGLHFLQTGRVYMIASPVEQLIDIRQLPALLSNPAEANRSSLAVLHELDVRIARMTKALNDGTVANGDADFTSDTDSNCTFSIFGKLTPERRLTTSELADYEAEVERPTGRTMHPSSSTSLNALAYSSNCGLLLDITNARSLLMDQFWAKAQNYAIALAVVAALQVYLLVQQMESTSTPSTIQRVAYGTIALQVGMDAYAFVTHLTLGVVTDNRASLSLLVPAFFLCASSLLFGLRYAASIRVATISSAPRPPPAPAPLTTAQLAARAAIERQNAEEAPPNVAPTPGEAAEIADTPTSRWADDSPIWVAVPLAMLISILVLLAVFGWIVCCLVGLYSYWVPQIYANAERDASRRTLQKRYIVGTAICRLYLPLYVWAYPDNILFNETTRWIWLLVAYQALQVITLLLQDFLGPRFFLPRGLFPARERWDYHPPLPSDLETGKTDCVICLEPIEVLQTELRWSYMVPPCHHIAHTKCLESWLAVKSECPVCRRPLPAV